MRDIRADLKERLARAEGQRASLMASLKELEGEVATIMRLLEIEDRREGGVDAPPASLTDFIVAVTKQGRLTKDEIREAALKHGYQIDGRNVHAATVNLLKGGALSIDDRGRYGPANTN